MNQFVRTINPRGIGNILCSGALPALFCLLISCSGQTNEQKRAPDSGTTGNTRIVGGPFENKEFMFYGIPEDISATDTSPGWTQQGQKILLTGIVYLQDGKTPAPGVIMYYYHTNTEGRYPHKPEEKRSMPPDNPGRTHGYIRGWVKTDAAGRYFIYTVKPGAYPGGTDPAHVHVNIKEPNATNAYYIDDFLFDDDPLLTKEKREKLGNRCGSGVVRMVQRGDLQIGERNLILGLNIPDY